MSDYQYVGGELELFAHARNWKAYLSRQIRPYLGDEVLEVGAGIGTTTRTLCAGKHKQWTCLEPDPQMAQQLTDRIGSGDLPACCKVVVGTVGNLDPAQRFDTILYIDVLEHIEDDADEAARACRFLKTNGSLVILSPAHPWLYTPFDKAIGHYRRYTRATLAAAIPRQMHKIKLIYLDSVGLLASGANRLLLRQSMPTLAQVKTWDRLIVPISRVLDPISLGLLGKSVLGIWRRPAEFKD